MGYGLNSQSSIPVRGKKFFSTPQPLEPTLGPSQPPIQWVLGPISPGIKRPGREADHSPPSSAEVKNDGGNLRSLIHLHGVVLN
jgi:hypothetical protein